MSGDGVVAHNRRTYLAENVDPTRTHLNIEYCYTPIEEAYHQLFDAALAEFNAKQKRKDRCIENYYEKIRDGKQEKTFYEVISKWATKTIWEPPEKTPSLQRPSWTSSTAAFLNAIPNSMCTLHTSTWMKLRPICTSTSFPFFSGSRGKNRNRDDAR